MKVKKIVAPTMSDAMKIIKQELGADAVILSSKEVKIGGIFGLFTQKNIEVIAAVEYEQSVYKPKAERKVVKNKVAHNEPIFPDFDSPTENDMYLRKSVENSYSLGKTPMVEMETELKTDVLVQTKEKEMIENKEEKTNDKSPVMTVIEEHNLVAEISDLKELIQELNTNVAIKKSDIRSQKVRTIKNVLMKHGVVDSHVATIVNQATIENKKNRGKSAAELLSFVLKKQLNGITFHSIPYHYKYIGLVGPTGVGKTTTLAKLAADAILNHNKKIAFITMDTYRIGAVEQLKRYASVLNVPVEVCYNTEDFKEAKKKLHHFDLIFIDTSGRNYREKKYVDELGELIQNKELYWALVFSMSSKAEDVRAMYEHFRTVPINSFIFTKFDETVSYGTMLNLILDAKIGVSYITNGQDVPDDIVPCAEDYLIELFAKEVTVDE